MKEIRSSLVRNIVRADELKGNAIFQHPGKIYTFLNPVSYLDALQHKDLYDPFDGIFADGSLLVLAIKAVYGIKVARRSFDMTSVAPELFGFARATGKSVYIVASRQEEVERAVEILQEGYPGLDIVGFRNGYFSPGEDDAEAEHIATLKPDFLIVGMGALMQERFLAKVKQAGFSGIGFTCGGFIHQTASNQIEYYPPIFDKLNIRFVYRFFKEKHTRSRYIKAAFVFPVRFLSERLRNK